MSPTGRLIGRSGELAGKKFELSGDTTVARGGTINISNDARARIYVQSDDFYIEGTGVLIDGSPLAGPTKLERMHVLEIGGLELVFTRTAAAVAAAPAPPAPAPPPPAPAPPAPPAPVETERTVVDMQGFGALPDLGRAPVPPAPPEPAPPPAAPAPPPPAPEERERTVVDMMGFGELPTLQPRAPTPPPAPVVPPPQPPPPPVPAAPAPVAPAPVAPAAEIDSDRTVAIPAPRLQRQFVLTVNIPSEGPRTFALKRGDNVLGRGDAADIKLPDPEQWLSRKHALVRVNDDDTIELVDLNGVNGTFVKGARVEKATLVPGATFVLGPNLEFKLQDK